MRDIERKSRRIAMFFCFLITVFLGVGCILGQTSRSVAGKDYIELKRYRILDEMGFDSPVEAMSMLVPKGWSIEGGVRWKSVNECRGEIIYWSVNIKSPDGAIQYAVLPVRTFVFSQDQMIQRTLMASAQQGGCQISTPFNAWQYLENLARNGLKATVSETRKDTSMQTLLDKFNADSNAMSRQYGTNMTATGSSVYGILSWPDGAKGLAQIGVMGSVNQSRDMYTGAPNGFATTTVFHQAIIRYPPEREAEALKIFATFNSSHRMNPIWVKAKESFLTQLGNAEHAGRMERLRLMGEQSRAYAKAQNDASNARMRDWERSQASSDNNQSRFIQTIREVETWKDSDGSSVELGAGYKYGWSKPDGSYIMTNNSLFNPAVELQENWSQMQKSPR